MKILFFTREGHPTFRVDVAVLFGKYLPRFGVRSDLVANLEEGPEVGWAAGRVFGKRLSGGRVSRHLQGIFNDLAALRQVNGAYGLVLVRDKPVFALVALIVSRLRGVPFGYWMSFPLPEEWLMFARQRGLSLGLLRFLVVYMRGLLSYFILYRVVLPRAQYAFLQSDAMVSDLKQRRVRTRKTLAVPMGVDHETIVRRDSTLNESQQALRDLMLARQTIVYLGTLERNRRLEVALHALKQVRAIVPDAMLVFIGDANEAEDVSYLKQLALELGLQDHVVFTGWLEIGVAWALAKCAKLGFSPFPRGPIHETASPTKTVEYLALGLPVVANDQPDQAWVITQSGGGVCTSLSADQLANGMVQLLTDPEDALRRGAAGQTWVLENRSYERIAKSVFAILAGESERRVAT